MKASESNTGHPTARKYGNGSLNAQIIRMKILPESMPFATTQGISQPPE